ncbi:unnamed protein product [Linum tenue]|uniref:Uncharacterized protein n=1 Tax=Linum tenue TaxID=586396 RepID=A0AAV0NJY3_9ROSI|nr:unnamed protein product [Linum tenue]
MQPKLASCQGNGDISG